LSRTIDNRPVRELDRKGALPAIISDTLYETSKWHSPGWRSHEKNKNDENQSQHMCRPIIIGDAV
jgi:hypothetical protein